MKTLVLHHISDATTKLYDNELLENTIFKSVGSSVGRFIFTKWEPQITILGNNVTVRNCEFSGRRTWEELFLKPIKYNIQKIKKSICKGNKIANI